MGSQPGAADWEHVVGRDLVPHLLPAGRPRGVHRPADVAWLPEGAHTAIAASVGRADLEDLLVVPAVAWPVGWWRRQYLYSPPCVMGIGERGVALWVQALPVPGVRALVPFGEIAAIEQCGDGPRRVFVVTGRGIRLPVRYHADGQAAVDAWTRSLRLRASGQQRRFRRTLAVAGHAAVKDRERLSSLQATRPSPSDGARVPAVGRACWA